MSTNLENVTTRVKIFREEQPYESTRMNYTLITTMGTTGDGLAPCGSMDNVDATGNRKDEEQLENHR